MEVGNDTAFGEEGRDYFYIGNGDDSGNGGAGVDVFLGGAGSDVFEGGSGVDYAWGEAATMPSSCGQAARDSGQRIHRRGTDDMVRLTPDTGISQALAVST